VNKADVIRMADECQLFDGIWSHPELKELKADKFIEFANLVAAAEREACAKVCIDSDRYRGDYFAAVIRARGQE